MEQHYFQINDAGLNIRCKLCSNGPGEVNTFVVCGHGFGGHKDNRAAERFAKHVLDKNHGAAVLTYNWPCHGDDVRKTLRLSDCDAYLSAVLAWVRSRYPSAALFGYATSFGGYLFLKYISEHGDPFLKTALRCPAVPMYEVITSSIMTGDDLERIKKGRPVSVGFDRKVTIDRTFLDELREADIAKRDFLPYADELFILHGTKDEVVPFDAVKAFAEDNVIDFEPVENADHRFQSPEKMDLAIQKICAFFGLR